jgi:hypothetical protein
MVTREILAQQMRHIEHIMSQPDSKRFFFPKISG